LAQKNDEVFDSEGNLVPVKKDVEPLAPIDHSKITYQSIEKALYEEHPDIAALSEQQVILFINLFIFQKSGP